jgi:hypothetical protein
MPASGWVASQCAWNGPTASFFLSVGTADSIEAFGDASAPDPEGMLDAYREETSGEERPDLADGAVLSSGGLALQQEDRYVEITRLRLSDDQLIAIGELVAAEL